MPVSQVLRDFAFDEAVFAELRARHATGALNRETQRLSVPPVALGPQDADAPLELASLDDERLSELRARGVEALRAGEVALLNMAGGMATRFGGGAKACARLREGSEDTFLSWSCRRVAALEAQLDAKIPWVVMTSFATDEGIKAALESAHWYGLDPQRRFAFAQSVLPRVDLEGRPLHELEEAAHWPPTLSFCAPGHGDTLGRLRDSGVLAQLQAQGVRHVLVANVDNLGATIDPVLVGAHLAAADAGAHCGVEVVARQPGEAGGSVARIEGRPQIVESFRLPEGTSLDDYPHFNTNTLWFALEALEEDVPLDWFAVRKELSRPNGEALDCVQFERLIGQATASLRTHFMSVPRELRFLPIKKRADLDSAAEQIDARLSNPDQFSLAFS